MNTEAILYALIGGILPALVWLFFWLREDRKNPEPRGLILRTFIFGMLAVFLVLPFQSAAYELIPAVTLSTFVLWSLIEEVFKLFAGYFGGIRTKEDNEPIDPIIYMITAALGFTALENALFLFEPILENGFLNGVMTLNLRFMGATLLHTLASGIVGLGFALSFYKSQATKVWYVLTSLVLAIVFHTGFNLLIVNENDSLAVLAFGLVWVGIVAILVLFEKVKRLRART